MDSPLVSVIVPAYNSARYLPDTLESVLRQGYAALKVIVVDDGSTDDTREVLKPYLKAIRYIYQDNGGPSKARNTGIAAAEGKYVAFLDSDDLWPPGKLNQQVQFMEAHPEVSLLFGDVQRFRDDRILVHSMFARKGFTTIYFGHQLYVEDAYRKLLKINYIPTGTVLLRRACLERTGVFDENLRVVEDRDLWLRVARIERIAYCVKIWERKRDHLGNVSADVERMALALIHVLEKQERLFGHYLRANALDLAAHLHRAYRDLGYRYLVNGRLRKARSCFRKALRRQRRARSLVYLCSTYLGKAAVREVCRLRAAGRKGLTHCDGDLIDNMEQKRVLYIENGIGYGGAVIRLRTFASSLDRNKYYPIIVTSRNDQNYQSLGDVAEWLYMRDRFIDKDKMVGQISSLFLKNKAIGRPFEIVASMADYLINFFPYLVRLLLLAMTKKVDLIHLNNNPVCNMGGIIVAKLMKIPCISHVCGPVWDSRTSRWLCEKVDYFITVAEWIKTEVLKLNVPENRIKTIWSGKKLEEFTVQSKNFEDLRMEFDLKPNQPSIGMIARLNPWKGHKVFLEAAEYVLRRFADCKILVVGGAAEKYREYEVELKTLVKKKELKNIIFTGQREDVVQFMGILDVIIHASTEPDPYPNVVIEAMAVGKPIIAPNIGGPVEMIENYRTGILIPPKDPLILGEKICELLGNPELRESLGREARKVARERYSISSHVQQIEQVYAQLLNRKSNLT